MILAAGRLSWRALGRFLDHNGPDRAAAVAYYTLLSLLPLLIFVISIGVLVFGSFEQAYAGTLFLFRGVVVHMDARTLEALRSFVERATRLQWPGLLLLAWTAKRAFSALFGALETVFEVPGRGFAQGNLLAFAMVLVTGLGTLLTLAMTMVVATVQGLFERVNHVPGAQLLQGLWVLFFTRAVPVLITFVFFFVVYRIVPRRRIGTRAAAAGALLATAMWEAGKSAFAYYLHTLAQYAGVYGALEGVIVLALWLELSVCIVLYCGEVVALLVPRRGGA